MAKTANAAATVPVDAPEASPIPDADNVDGQMALAEAEDPAPGEETLESAPVAEATVQIEFTGVPPYGRHFHSTRVLSRKDLDKVGIKVDKDLEFSPFNGWVVDVPADNKRLVEYFRNVDAGFVVND